MFEEIEMIRTKDGEIFDCEERAAEYIVEKVSEEINEMLKGKDAPNCGFQTLLKVILCLSGDVDKIQRLHKITSKYV